MFISAEGLSNEKICVNSKLNSFFYSDLFPIIIAIIAVVCYTFDLTIIGFCIFIALAIIIFITNEDVTPIIPLLMMVLMQFRNFDLFLSVWTYIPCALALVAIILHFILYPIKKIEKGKLYLPIILVSIALFLGGILSPYLYTYHLGIASRIATGPVILIVYFFFTNYIKPPKGFDIARYICLCLTVVGLLCTLELIHYNYLMGIKDLSVNAHTIGWNNSNGVASILLVCIPACFYLLLKNSNVITIVFSIVVMFAGLVLSYSDGCLAIGIVSFPILCFFTYINADKKTKPKLIVALLILLFLVIVGVLIWLTQSSIYEIINVVKEQMASEHGRTELYLEALNHFINYPVFGIGFGFTPEDSELLTNAVIVYNYHSTFFHVIATMGTVGFFAFLYYFINRYKVLTANGGAFNTFAFLSFTLMEVYGFIDCCEFNVMPLMIIVSILLIIVEKSNNNKENLLPLTRQI